MMKLHWGEWVEGWGVGVGEQAFGSERHIKSQAAEVQPEGHERGRRGAASEPKEKARRDARQRERHHARLRLAVRFGNARENKLHPVAHSGVVVVKGEQAAPVRGLRARGTVCDDTQRFIVLEHRVLRLRGGERVRDELKTEPKVGAT